MKTRILIADDHALLRDSLRVMLGAEAGFSVAGEASDLREIVAAVRKHTPDVLLLDLMMPGGSGVATIARLANEHPDLRVLVLSIADDDSLVRAALAAGAAGYVLKRSAYLQLVAGLKQVRAGALFLDPALRASTRGPTTATPVRLTPREREVLRLLASGLTYRDVATRLRIGDRTVETHRRKIADKLGLKSRADMIRYSLEVGLIGSGRS